MADGLLITRPEPGLVWTGGRAAPGTLRKGLTAMARGVRYRLGPERAYKRSCLIGRRPEGDGLLGMLPHHPGGGLLLVPAGNLPAFGHLPRGVLLSMLARRKAL